MLIVGIAGGTGSGKTTVVRKIMEQLPADRVILVPQDAYYKDNSHIPMEERKEINFDHPDSVEFDLLIDHLKLLLDGQPVEQPQYSYLSCTRSEKTTPVQPAEVIILEGILILTSEQLRELIDIKVFVDADNDDRLARVIRRDMEERGRSAAQVLERYDITVKPMHLQFIEPSKRYADIIIPQGGENKVAIEVLVSMLRERLTDRVS